MNQVSVAFRVDSGTLMGSGHLMRCLTLATELKARGADARFICREHQGHLIARIENAGYEVHRLPNTSTDSSSDSEYEGWLGATQLEDAQDTSAALGGSRVDWLVVDHYGIDARWETAVRRVAKRLLVIDDLANRPHDADVILDQNYLGDSTPSRYDRHVNAQCRRLLGPRYALLQPIYRRVRQVCPARDGTVRRLMIFFGSYDATRAAVAVLKALRDPGLSHLKIDVVPGNDRATIEAAYAAARERDCVAVHQDLPTLAELMARADLAIGAGGVSTWERACLGLPALVATTAGNQFEIARALAADGFIAFAGPSSSVSSGAWRAQVRELLDDPERIASLGRRSLSLTDGWGAGRVARAMLGRFEQGLFVRVATDSDERLLLDWANDPDVRRMAFNPGRIDEQDHARWFSARRADSCCTILIGEDTDGLPLGQVRFDADPDRREASVHIAVDAAFRGTGVGSALLRNALDFWRKRAPGYAAVAEVLQGNRASERLFVGAGFSPTTPRRANSHAFILQPDSRSSMAA
jgi:UDP-2,4-diacetamido-2,4,6-trideoxy-beta-L-altropyranose hydrolase